ncbi:MAG: DUF418 domain-containing protein [Bacillus sp. (in: firmicutes)]
MKDFARPIDEKDRLITIDVIRGFALLGIFFVNMPTFFSPYLYIDPKTYWENGLDSTLSSFVETFMTGSFYPLFAFLFGFGAILQYERLRSKGLSFPKHFSRRLFVLLLIGVIHAFLFWHGDILITYAIGGAVFLLFYKLKPLALLLISILSYGIFFGLFALLTLIIDQDFMMKLTYDAEAVERSLTAYGDGNFQDVFSQRMQDWLMVNGPQNFWLLILSIVPFMMIGAAFAKNKWLVSVQKHKRMLVAIMIFAFVSGFFLKTLSYLPFADSFPFTAMVVKSYIGGPLLTFFYISALALLLDSEKARAVLHPFSYAGRMSVTNYLFQSVLFTSLFYSYGLGLYGNVSYSVGFVLVIITFALQVWFSKWWLSRYRFGPVEFLWRWGTYGKKPVNKRIEEQQYEIGNS